MNLVRLQTMFGRAVACHQCLFANLSSLFLVANSALLLLKFPLVQHFQEIFFIYILFPLLYELKRTAQWTDCDARQPSTAGP